MKPYEEIDFPNGFLRWIREDGMYVCSLTEEQMEKIKALHEASRTWVGLMEDEAMEVALEVISRLDLPTTTKMQLEQQFLHALSNPNSLWMLFAAEIEAKLEEKNG